MTCLTPEQIDRYAQGTLDSALAAEVEAHIEQCDACRRKVEAAREAERFLDKIKDLPGGISGPSAAGETGLLPPNAPTGVGGDTPPPSPMPPPDSFPGYQIIREIHRGGQGVVYQAIQESTKQKVAIKVLLEGCYASPGARRRFEREIELVAQLKHPNIISIFHAGQTSDGRQFLVMEYIRGMPLLAYVREKKLALDEALRLFARLCEAVQFAHQRGIIHRDLKPSNILADAAGEPKVLDFGLAKWLASPAETLDSLSHQVMGTLPYMSPEQARGKPDEVDTRTDIYSLGVILYEILTGEYPYSVAGQMAEVLRRIAEQEPTPPSRNWSPDSGIRRRSPGRRSFGLRWYRRREVVPIDDEVETIVLRCLSKERERRYQSAGELARDIGHYLQGEPIEAKRDSALYVLRKQLRRFKVPVVIAALFTIVVTGGFVTSAALWRQAVDAEREQRRQLTRAEDATQRAEENQEQAEESARRAMESAGRAKQSEAKAKAAEAESQQITLFLTEMIGSLNPYEGRRGETTVKQLLDAAARRAETDLKDRPKAVAAIRDTLGLAYASIGYYEHAEDQLGNALTVSRETFGPESPEVALNLRHLGYYLSFHQARGLPHRRPQEYKKALELCAEALRISRDRWGPGDPRTLQVMCELSHLHQLAGDYVEAEEVMIEGLRIFSKDKLHRADLRSLISFVLRVIRECNRQGYPGVARAVLRLCYGPFLREEDFGDWKSREQLPVIMTVFAERRFLQEEDYAAAEPILREALRLGKKQFSDHHLIVAWSQEVLAGVRQARGDLEGAEKLLRDVLQTRRLVLGLDHPQVAATLESLDRVLMEKREFSESQEALRECLEIRRKRFGKDHWLTAYTCTLLGDRLTALGKYEEAEELLVPSNRILQTLRGPDDELTKESLQALNKLHAARERLRGASPDE